MAKTSGSDSRGGSGAQRQALLSFLEEHEGLLKRLEDAARDRLNQASDSIDLRGIRIEIRVTPDQAPAATDEAGPGTQCWEEDYICGKSRTGYIHCHHTICMEVGPVTLSE